MKVIKSRRFWAWIISGTVGTISWKGLVIDQATQYNIVELWLLWGVIFLFFSLTLYRKEVASILWKDKTDED